MIARSLALLAALGFHQPEPPKYTLVYVPIAGTKHTYKTTVTTGKAEDQVVSTVTADETVEEVLSEGRYSLRHKVTASEFTYKGKTETDSELENFAIVFKPDGTIEQFMGVAEEQQGAEARGMNIFGFYPPDAKVGVGEKWSKLVPKGSIADTVAIKANFTLEALEKLGEKDALKIIMENEETDCEDPSTFKGTLWLDAKDFTILKMEGETTTKYSDSTAPSEPTKVVYELVN